MSHFLLQPNIKGVPIVAHECALSYIKISIFQIVICEDIFIFENLQYFENTVIVQNHLSCFSSIL